MSIHRVIEGDGPKVGANSAANRLVAQVDGVVDKSEGGQRGAAQGLGVFLCASLSASSAGIGPRDTRSARASCDQLHDQEVAAIGGVESVERGDVRGD